MVRRPLKLLRLLSLLLCLAVAGVWALTRMQVHQFVFTTGDRLWWVRCDEWTISTITVKPWPKPEQWRWIHDRDIDSADRLPVIQGKMTGAKAGTNPVPLREWQWLSVRGQSGPVETLLDEHGSPVSLVDAALWETRRGRPLHSSAAMAYQSAGAPLWMLLVAFAAYPLASFARGAVLRRLRRRRAVEGLCAHCGYSLAGNVSGVCPECGIAQ